MASHVVHIYLVELDCFIALLSALLSLWWSSILLNLFFVSWFVLLKFVLCFFCIWLWCLLFHNLCCRSLSCCFGLTLKMSLLFCCVWFIVCVFLLLWKFDLLGVFVLLIGLWFLFAWKILLNFICALCWVLLIKEVYFLIEMTAHF